jgi:hypothetical protein
VCGNMAQFNGRHKTHRHTNPSLEIEQPNPITTTLPTKSRRTQKLQTVTPTVSLVQNTVSGRSKSFCPAATAAESAETTAVFSEQCKHITWPPFVSLHPWMHSNRANSTRLYAPNNLKHRAN